MFLHDLTYPRWLEDRFWHLRNGVYTSLKATDELLVFALGTLQILAPNQRVDRLLECCRLVSLVAFDFRNGLAAIALKFHLQQTLVMRMCICSTAGECAHLLISLRMVF